MNSTRHLFDLSIEVGEDEDRPEDDIPDVIFLDLNMPIVDGFKFLFEFSKMNDLVRSKVKIIVLTSSDNIRDKEKVAANPDVLAYVSKPLTDAKLEAISNML